MKVVSYPALPNRWAIHSKHFSPALVRLAKQTPGMRWDKTAGLWWGCYDAVSTVEKKLREEGILFEEREAPDTSAVVDKASCKQIGLRDYQADALEFMFNTNSGSILALDMGLGKTRTTIEWMKVLNYECGAPCVVVCPAFVTNVWEQELAKWWPECNYEMCRHAPPVFGYGREVFVISYDTLHKWVEYFREKKVRGLVLDECHILVDERSRRSQACRDVREFCEFAVGLTGTPLTGKLKAAWNVIDIVSPGRMGSFFNFARRYCGAVQETVNFHTEGPKAFWNFDGRSNEAELAERYKHFLFRRTREEAALELPPMTRTVVKVNCESRYSFEGSTPGAFKVALSAAAEKKLPETLRIVTEHVEAGSKIVVFTYRRAVAEKIAGELSSVGIDAAFMHGEMPVEKRAEMLRNPPQVLCATIDSCGVGVSLAHANVAVFAELSYEAWKLRQAEARLHRHGQNNPVLVLYVVGAGSAEDVVIDHLIAKLDTEAVVLGEDVSGFAGALQGGAESESEALAAIWEAMGNA